MNPPPDRGTPSPADDALQRLGTDYIARRVSDCTFRQGLLDIVRERFGCNRACLWRRVEGAGTPTWLCVARWTSDGGHDAGGERVEDDASDDIGAAAATALDDAIAAASTRQVALCTLNGHTFGLLSCERAPAGQPWQRRETAALRRLASALSLIVARHEAARIVDDAPPR